MNNTIASWEQLDTYTFRRSDIIDYFQEMQNNTFDRGWCCKRTIMLQGLDRKILKFKDYYQNELKREEMHLINPNNLEIIPEENKWQKQ